MFWKSDDPSPAPDSGRARRPRSLAFRLTGWYAISGFLLLLVPTLYLYLLVAHEVYVENDNDVLERIDRLRWILQQNPTPLAQLKREVNVEPLARPRDEYLLRIRDEAGHILWETPRLGKLLPTGVFPAPPPVAAGALAPVSEASSRAELAQRRKRFDTTRSPMIKFRTANGRPFLLCSTILLSDDPLQGDPSFSARDAMAAGAASAAASAASSTPSASPTAPEPHRYTVQIAMDESSDERMLAAYRSDIYIVMGAALIACIFISYLIAHGGLRPIEQMKRLISGISSTALTQRVQPTGFPSELSSLAERFNDMLDRLEDAFDRLARFSADIAHELRTPLNNLRGETEVALGKPRSGQEYRDVLGSCLEEYVRLSRMIDSLLFLARAENPETRINRESVDVKHELESLRDFYEASAEESRVELKVLAVEGLRAHVDRLLLQRAIGNLVENALAFTPAGGRITITAAPHPAGASAWESGISRNSESAVRIEVSDTGCGIPAEHLPYIFDRFRRVDEARSKDRPPKRPRHLHADSAAGAVSTAEAESGNQPAADVTAPVQAPGGTAPISTIGRAGLGLGLSLVKGIVTLHGGSVQIESRPGAGTRVTLIFPK